MEMFEEAKTPRYRKQRLQVMGRTEEVCIAVLADYIDEEQHTLDRGRKPECST